MFFLTKEDFFNKKQKTKKQKTHIQHNKQQFALINKISSPNDLRAERIAYLCKLKRIEEKKKNK